jgi:hypothetical protein
MCHKAIDRVQILIATKASFRHIQID